MIDKFGREISYLRLSVTENCNSRCLYCMPEISQAEPPDNCLRTDELVEIAAAAVNCGIRKIRITGGEPLVRHDILSIVQGISSIPGIDELCVTTNGLLLPQYAQALKTSGVHRLNISLDSLNAACYRTITRGGSVQQALAGLQAAKDAGFDRIKINVVLMAKINDREISDLAELTRHHEIDVRFIEVMPMGDCAAWARQHFVSSAMVLDALPKLRETGSGGVAKLYRLPGCRGTIGLISPMSSHFCPSCNRIRVTADGKLKPCLHSSDEFDLRGLSGCGLEAVMMAAIQSKPFQHLMDADNDSFCRRPMNAIGG